jgi:hypothetical protein
LKREKRQQNTKLKKWTGFFWQKHNKKGTEDKDSGTWITSFHSLLSNANSLVIHQFFKSFFTDSSYVKFGYHLPLLSLPVCLITPLWIGASAGLRWICPNHLKWYYTSFSLTGATPVSHIRHRFGPDLFLCCHKSIVACTS